MIAVLFQIFLIQACQQDVPSRQTETVSLMRHNTVLLMAAVPYGVAVRGAYTGAFSDVLLNGDGEANIMNIHTLAVGRMKRFDGAEQTPTVFSNLTKGLLLTSQLESAKTSLLSLAAEHETRIGNFID